MRRLLGVWLEASSDGVKAGSDSLVLLVYSLGVSGDLPAKGMKIVHR